MTQLTVRRTALLAVSLLISLVLASPALAQDWAGRGRVQGLVTDEEGNPLQGAKVSLYLRELGNGPEPFETNKKGRWSYLGLSHGTWNVLIEYPGLVQSEGSLPVNEFGTGETLKVALRKIPEQQLAEEAAVEAVRMLNEGNELLVAGKSAEARAVYESALGNLDPGYHHLVKIGIANSYLNEDNAAQAVATLEPLLAEHSDELQLQHALARSYYQAGKVDESLSLLKGIVDADATDVETLRLLIDLLVRADREVEAQAYMEKLPEGESLSADTVLNTGVKLYNNGDLDGALAQFDRAATDHPDLPDVFYFRGLVHLGKEQNAEAISDFKRLLELAPEHANAGEAKQFLEYLESIQ